MEENINLAKLDIDASALIKSASEVKETLDQLRKMQKALTEEGDTSSEAYVELASHIKTMSKAYSEQIGAITKHTKALSDQNKRVADLNTILGLEVHSIEEAREQNKLLNQLRNQTNVTTKEGAEELRLLNEQLDRNNDFIYKNADGFLRLKMNIGNYAGEVKDSFSQMNIFNGGLSGFIDRANEAGGVSNLLKNSFSGVTSGLVGMAKAGWAFIATPIGATITAITVAATAMVKIFKVGSAEMQKTSDGTLKYNSALAKLQSIAQPLFKWFEKYALGALNDLIDGFNFLYDATMKAVEGLGQVMKAIGLTEAGEATQQWANNVQKVTKENEKILQLQNEYNKKSREARLIQLQYQRDAEKLRQIRDDESLSIEQRIQANKDLGALLKKQALEELAIQQINLRAIEAEIKLKGNLAELEDKRIQALTEIADIQERITGQESEQKTNINSLVREQQQLAQQRKAEAKQRADEAKQRAKERQQEATAQLNEQLRIFLAENQARGKSEAEQTEILEKEIEKRKAIAQSEFDASEKRESDKLKLQATQIELENELILRRVELAQQVADRELQIFKENNAKKLTEGQYINAEIYEAELKRISDIGVEEAKALTQRYNSKLISEAEYLEEIDRMNREAEDAQDELERQYVEQEKQREAIDLQNKLDNIKNNFLTEYQLKMEQLEAQRKLELEQAEKTGADKALINEKYNQLQQQQDEIMNENKVSLASQAFGNLATIFGENSRMGKAMAIMQTTIDTYQSATSAYKALAGIPVVGPALGAVAAGAAIASGIANVRKIQSTKEPKFATGGIYEVGGRLHSAGGTKFTGSDGSRFELERGEGVGILSRSQFATWEAFRGSLNQINAMNGSSSGNIYQIVEAIRSMPAPRVTVEDINIGQQRLTRVINYADL